MNLTAVLQIITTVVIGIIGFFLQDKMKKLEEADRKNECRIEETYSKNEDRINCIEKEFSEFKEKMPLMYTTREDQLRAQASLENRIEKLSTSMEQGFEKINTRIENKLDSFTKGVDEKINQLGKQITTKREG